PSDVPWPGRGASPRSCRCRSPCSTALHDADACAGLELRRRERDDELSLLDPLEHLYPLAARATDPDLPEPGASSVDDEQGPSGIRVCARIRVGTPEHRARG